MQRFGSILICLLVFCSVVALADTFTLTDGTKIEGTPIFPVSDGGVVFRSDTGDDLPRVPWDKISQESIRAILALAKADHDRLLIAPLIEQLPEERAQRQAQRHEIVVKEIQPPTRPTSHLGLMAVFSSPVGLALLFILYAANLFAAYEVAVYRLQPAATVCGLAAIPFFGVLSPIIFIAMPTRRVAVDGQEPPGPEENKNRFRATPPPAAVPAPAPGEAAAPAGGITAPPPEDAGPSPGPASVPQQPGARRAEPVIFKRGEFTFNRRFFETKLNGFLRVVPSEADKDLVLQINSARGNLIGRRISRITPSELYLQVFRENATAEEMIPFTEVLEVQIRHKDTV